MRLGLLSTARINDKVIAGAAQSEEEVEITAVASRDGERARVYADGRGIPHAHGSYAALIDDPELDAVYISLPNHLHVEWSVRALQAGKHVLCEKPLTRHPEEAERAFAAAESAGRVLMEGFMWRHTPQVDTLLGLLPRLGELRLIRSHFSFGGVPAGDVRLDPALDGGALMDVGCYPVSAARLVAAAEPEAVHAVARPSGTGVDMAMAGALRFPGGLLAHFDCGMDLAGESRHELEVVGSAAAVRITDPFHGRQARITLDDDDVPVAVRDPYACELDAFAVAAAGGPQRFGRDDAVGQARVLAALRESAAGR